MDELRRQNYLRMMGVTQWRLRHAEPDDAISQAVVEAEADVTQAEQPAPVGDAVPPTESVNLAEDRSDWLTLR
ncbi:MAG: DNA polymerase III subunit psi, partial [Candidatus Thiodiazotropha taylori]|nr:DNA polymerase III subunit psi [Candidatus Thiodiazotropha taylori]MCW4327472.1 DNA polymerase III subunit psi [Candidatus Thiodiazotropha taylori]